MNKTPTEKLRARWLEAFLPEVPFDGWSEAAAKTAAEKAGLSDGEQALAAPGGIFDLMEAFFDQAEEEAKAALEKSDPSGLRVHEKVARGVRVWLDILEPNREAVRRAVSRGFLPFGKAGAPGAMQRTWSLADMIWEAAGDTSDDYNRYTKRALLAICMPPIIMHWLDSPQSDELDAYIAKRLKQASGLGRGAGKVAKPILDFMGGLRSRTGRKAEPRQ